MLDFHGNFWAKGDTILRYLLSQSPPAKETVAQSEEAQSSQTTLCSTFVNNAALFNLHGQSFLATDPHQLKPPTELVLPGYPNMAAPVMTEKMTQNTEDHRGGLQNSPPVSRVLPPSQALRGTPLAPQYFMATPQYYLPTQTMPHTAATPQAIPITSQPYLYSTTPALTGYESINPYVQAFYQHATLFTQPAVTTLDRQGQQRYATTE